jgi:hypothetical protein
MRGINWRQSSILFREASFQFLGAIGSDSNTVQLKEIFNREQLGSNSN